jgi:hypothetical protein
MQSDARWRRSGDIVVAQAPESVAHNTIQKRNDCETKHIGERLA